MIDTHSHIYLEEFDEDRSEVVQRALSAGVRHMVMPNVDMKTFDSMVQTCRSYPACTSMAMGLHPTSVDAGFREQLAEVAAAFDRYPFVAVGEVGIDLYWDKTFAAEQMEAFDTQLHWAERRGLPVIVHCRDGLDAILSVFEGYGGVLPMCVFHSFGGTVADIDRIRAYGDFYFGINGIVTFKNSHLSEALDHIGIERILLETDCPYLTPVPYRGRRNESGYVPYVAAKVAETLGITIEKVSEITDRNAEIFFKSRF